MTQPPDAPTFTWAAVLSALLSRRDLTLDETAWAMARTVAGEATPAQVAAFATALRAKGETPAEIAGLVTGLLGAAAPVVVPGPTADLAGTGGDRTGAANISTMAAVVAAATGAVTMVKHGGRAASSSTAGAADLVEHLGVPLDLTAAQAAGVAARAGITFLFAPTYNPGLRHVAAVRRELGVPTVFNALGPLLNPAAPDHQVIGVADAGLAPVLAGAVALLGRSALLAHGHDGLDKLTTVTTSTVWTVRDNRVSTTILDPRMLDIAPARPADLKGGSAPENARLTWSTLDGKPGPIRDVTVLNAAAVLVAATLTSAPLLEQFAAALSRCARAIDSGAAHSTLTRWIAETENARADAIAPRHEHLCPQPVENA